MKKLFFLSISMLAIVALTTSCSNDDDEVFIEEGATGIIFDDNTSYCEAIGFPWEEFGVSEIDGTYRVFPYLSCKRNLLDFEYETLNNWPMVFIGQCNVPSGLTKVDENGNDTGEEDIYMQAYDVFLPLFGADFEAAMKGEDMSYIKGKYFNTDEHGYITSLKPEGAQYVRGARIAYWHNSAEENYEQWKMYWVTTEFGSMRNMIIPEVECQKETGRNAKLAKSQEEILNKYTLPAEMPWRDLRNLPFLILYEYMPIISIQRMEDQETCIKMPEQMRY